MKTWFFLDLLSSLPVDYIFLVLDSGLLDTHLVSRFKISFLINGDQTSVEQAKYATTSAVHNVYFVKYIFPRKRTSSDLS